MTHPSAAADPRDAYFDVSHLKEAAARRAGRSSMLVLTLAAAKLVLHLGSTIILVRLIPPEEFGIASLAMPIALIAMNLSQFGLAQPIVQMPDITHRLVSTLFWVNVVLGVAFGGLLAAGSGLAARFYGVPEVAPVFMALGVSVVFTSILTQYIAILRRRLQIPLLEYGSLVAFAGAITIAIVAALLGASYWAVVLQQLSQAVLNVVIFAAGTRWFPSPPTRINLREARGALKFGGNVAVFNLTQQISLALPTIMVGRLFTPLETGLYQRAQTLANLLPARTASPLASVYVSTFSRLQDDAPAFRAMFERVVTRMNLLLMPAAVVVFVTSDIFVPVVLGQNWAPMAPVLAWLGLIMLQITLEQGLTWSLIACNGSRYLLYYAGWGLALMCATIALTIGQGIVTLAMGIIVMNQCLRVPLLAVFALRQTHLTLRDLLRGYGIDLVLALAAIGAALGLRALMPEGAALQFFGAAGLVALIYLGRVLADPGLSRDVFKALRMAVRR